MTLNFGTIAFDRVATPEEHDIVTGIRYYLLDNHPEGNKDWKWEENIAGISVKTWMYRTAWSDHYHVQVPTWRWYWASDTGYTGVLKIADPARFERELILLKLVI